VVPSPSAPSPAGVDDYKTQVARHVAAHNPERMYSGTLPPILPAIVVLRITVDRDGQLDDVAVLRSRDPEASEIALTSVRRSNPLPAPQQLAQATGKLMFLETFLFADSDRYQLRSLADPQP
jgi:protein TonB